MLKVLIVDDEMFARDELRYLLERTKEVDAIDEAEHIEEAFDKMADQKPDILFLDIDLSGENGFDIAKRLKKMSAPPAVVFATAYDEYALKAFEVDAIDYLTKPFDEERIRQTIKKYRRMHPENKEEKPPSGHQRLALNVDESIVILDTSEIVYAGLKDGRVVVKTFDASYAVHDTLVVLEQKLPQSLFIRVHRSFLANMDHMKEVKPWFNSTYNLLMKDGSTIPVSRTYAKELKKLLHMM
ncbi:two-component response regulator [Bacillus glycinifermentans]|uniref:LytTR family DNA-binding domain-containing protein n=1 Tax=Bacillus glycinifermentans TaxID=1664069 RepID=A0A0J6EF17_9BACI|nr:LytTR family DNA-binding domain-containing protein [Bacillus glycinifermentans]ATH92735.1 DNA-binding response regulator [Bacillus glycinifermentans]KMM62704.1 two-component response regulator [Bacillus glycinifermentans]KRT94758.1 two-component system response regulator [Bacillus glycinifermentans]MEC0485560.1 LytTR family DNA-binding domain-containing protein [Bacillus glycinifermentans]MEC0493506.1 LytTR family DNA-binding domain-containing protein [Bacillus glycinifermentans]